MFWRCTRYVLIGQLWNCSRGEGSPQVPPHTYFWGCSRGEGFPQVPPLYFLSVYLSICLSAVLQYCRFTEAAPSVSLPLCLSLSLCLSVSLQTPICKISPSVSRQIHRSKYFTDAIPRLPAPDFPDFPLLQTYRTLSLLFFCPSAAL